MFLVELLGRIVADIIGEGLLGLVGARLRKLFGRPARSPTALDETPALRRLQASRAARTDKT